MGWFWGSPDDEKPGATLDPLRNLDLESRNFLNKQPPITRRPWDAPLAPQDLPETATELALASSPIEQCSKNDTGAASKVPPQSLFKDGRFAHLWSTYQPQAEVESTLKSDAEKVNDVLQGYKQRKAEIGRAALENCAMEQWDVNECFQSGGMAARLTMCRAENRKFERCYLMQARFLKALGYLSTYDRLPEIDEKIQMHADTLYHRMIDQEAAIEAAKAEGKSVPIFPPLVSTAKTDVISLPTPAQAKKSDLPPAVQAQLKKRLDGLDEKERNLEERAITAEIKAGEEVAGQLGNIYQKQRDEKQVRKEQGKETISDKLSSIFGIN